MANRIWVVQRASHWLTLVTASLIAIISALSLSLTAERASASAHLTPPAQSDDLAEAKRLNAEVVYLYNARKYDEAMPLAERSLAIREKTLGPDHPDVAESLGNLALLYFDTGDSATSEPLFQRALAIYEKVLGTDDLARLNARQVGLYRAGRVPEAMALAVRALEIRDKALNVALALNRLARFYDNSGDYAKAEPLYQRGLAIYEKAIRPDEPTDADPVASSLDDIAQLYVHKGDYAKAEPLFKRALALREKARGPDHPVVSISLNNLALLYQSKGDSAKAEPLYQRALAIFEKERGPNHPFASTFLNNLGGLYENKGDYAKAEPLYERALAIRENALGPDDINVAGSLISLAGLYHKMGDNAEAEPLFTRALSITEKLLGPDHPDLAFCLSGLAGTYAHRGEYAKAEALYQRALMIYEKTFGPDHKEVATSLNNLATLYEAKADPAGAVAFRLRATNISERNIALNVAAGSERQKLLYLSTFSSETDRTVSLHVRSAPNDQAARRLALTTIFRRKGRALDAIADSIGALRRRLNPRDRALLSQLTDTRSALATLALRGPTANLAQHRAKIKLLEEQAETLEAQISARSVEFRVQSQPVTIELIQRAIPVDSVLVEFVSYFPYDSKTNKWGLRSYVAYVLANQGEPAWVSLGAAAEIDEVVNELRAVLRKDEDKPLSDIERELKPKARMADQKIMQPVRKLLGDKRKLLLSPDGSLNLIPFASLVDEKGKYLIESYSLTYLTTGRDLLRLQTRIDNKQGAAVFANPYFGAYKRTGSGRILKMEESGKKTTNGNKTENGDAPTPIDFSQAYFPALPGTAQEAKALSTMFPDAKVWTQALATKTGLKQVTAPAFLHIATHGFFLDDVVVSAAEAKSRGLFIRTNQREEMSAPEFHVEDPLLRSGLAFAGANLHRRGDDDGILTAREASGLNLWGTKLVVLSACDTGVGEVKNGEGVYGLRRALVLAGSQTQVMSLWPVSDEGTRDLMIEYYKALKAGQGRSEGLRQVQLKMLASSVNRQHPYYWASFIQSGEWANLDGKR